MKFNVVASESHTHTYVQAFLAASIALLEHFGNKSCASRNLGVQGEGEEVVGL